MSNPDLGNGRWVKVDIEPEDQRLVGRYIKINNKDCVLEVKYVGKDLIFVYEKERDKEWVINFLLYYLLWEPEQEKPEPREIERMGNNYMLGSANRGLANKINELVDAINELRRGDYGSKVK